jgi:membrane protein YqaA with SNARE-associated domain
MIRFLRRNLHNLKAWVESFAEKPYALWALFAIAFVESAILPIPPDVLLLALGVARPRRAILYGFVTALGGILGGFLGYYIGFAGFSLIGEPILRFFGVMGKFDWILQQYRANAIFALFVSGFTPVPYIAFTLAAGFNRTLSLGTLAIGSALGRLFRFLLVGTLLYFFGPPVKSFIDRYFEKLSVAFAGALLVLIVAVKLFL